VTPSPMWISWVVEKVVGSVAGKKAGAFHEGALHRDCPVAGQALEGFSGKVATTAHSQHVIIESGVCWKLGARGVKQHASW
jgi:hypothetical protein